MEFHAIQLESTTPEAKEWLRWLDDSIAAECLATRMLLQKARRLGLVYQEFADEENSEPEEWTAKPPQNRSERDALREKRAARRAAIVTKAREEMNRREAGRDPEREGEIHDENPLYTLLSDLFQRDADVWKHAPVAPGEQDRVFNAVPWGGYVGVLVEEGKRYLGHIYMATEPKTLSFVGIRKSLREILRPSVRGFAWIMLGAVAAFALALGRSFIKPALPPIGKMLAVWGGLEDAQKKAVAEGSHQQVVPNRSVSAVFTRRWLRARAILPQVLIFEAKVGGTRRGGRATTRIMVPHLLPNAIS